MTDPHADVVVSYERFLERQDRRRLMAAALIERDRPRTIDNGAPLAAAVEADGGRRDVRTPDSDAPGSRR